jgi:cytoskeleton protein RodZ
LRQNTRVPRIGETLRDARIRQSVDISEVEKATKIRAKYLRALENEEFDLLPGPTFVRSFLKTYAEHLGLDARMLVEEFRTDYEGLPEEEPAPAFGGGPSPGRRREPVRYDRRAPSIGVIIGGAVAAILVLFLVLGLTGGDDPPPSGGGAAGQAGDRDEDRRARRRRARARAADRRDRPRSVSLKISPEGPTYTCVDRGEGETPLYEGSLTSTRTFRGKRLRLNLGRPSARVRVNGRAVDLGSEDNPVGFAFSPGKKPRPLPLSQRPCV